MPLTPVLERFITAMPKVELHVHLEGAIAPKPYYGWPPLITCRCRPER
ncbi:MAG TPA: hypothetical protein VNL71_13255 [Chloroflexota bacterium]|nr:hypothetical protein [Chloroflexota bacterium]